MTRRRVLIVPAWYPMADDPVAGIFVREQAQLVAVRHDVVVLYPFEPGVPPRGLWEVRDAVEDGIRTVRVRRRRLPLPKHDLPLTVAGARAALRHLRAGGFRPDLIHAHVFSAATVARLAAGRRVPLLVTEHYSALARGRVRGLERRVARFAYRTAQLLAPVSENLVEPMRALAPATPFRVVPNSVDTDRFRPSPSDEGRNGRGERLLVVGSLVPGKAVPIAIEAFARLCAQRPGATLEIVGDGPERPACEALARRLGVGGAVSFHGRLDRDRVAALMRSSDVLVSPSQWENLPGVQLEALASGLPVVATAVGGVPALVDRDSGRLVRAGDVNGLAGAIAEVLERRGEFSSAGIAERIRLRFGRDRVAAMWDEEYAHLTDAVGQGPAS